MEREPGADGPSGPVAYVNIMQGCDNFCAYCIVPFTRGRQKSRATPAILDECRTRLDQGAREITLLGQNVNAFGHDKSGDGVSFAQLLAQVAALPGLERLRFVTPHPKDMGLEDVAAFAELAPLCPRLHLPLQAGSDAVLTRMRRRYDRRGFLELVDSLRNARPDLALSTDRSDCGLSRRERGRFSGDSGDDGSLRLHVQLFLLLLGPPRCAGRAFPGQNSA